MFVGYNDNRVTGHALTLPYQAYERQYGVFVPLNKEAAHEKRGSAVVSYGEDSKRMFWRTLYRREQVLRNRGLADANSALLEA